MSDADLVNYLAKLVMIRDGLFTADNELCKLAKEHQQLKAELTGFQRPPEGKERRLEKISIQAVICLEGIIVELFNLSEVRTKFLNNIQHAKIQKILIALQPCSDILDMNDRLIRELRNNIIAHGEIQGDTFRGTTDIFQNQSEPWKRIFLSAKCGSMFTSGLIENLILQVVHAKRVIQDHMNVLGADTSEYFVSMKDAKSMKSTIMDNLTDAGLNREISFVGLDD